MLDIELEVDATKEIRMLLNVPGSPDPVALSTKLAGDFVEIHNFLLSKGYRNKAKQVKCALMLFAYAIARGELGRPLEIGHNDLGVPKTTPVVEALGLCKDDIYQAKKRIRKSWSIK